MTTAHRFTCITTAGTTTAGLATALLLGLATACAPATPPTENDARTVQRDATTRMTTDRASTAAAAQNSEPSTAVPSRPSLAPGASRIGTSTTVNLRPAFQTGEISYYSDALAGNLTASGEIYDPSKDTCAHPTLAFGTDLEIRELVKFRTAKCRVNDRGPFAKGRILDVSRAVATRLGFLEAGHVNAELRRLP